MKELEADRGFSFRHFQREDAAIVSALIIDNLLQVNSRDYGADAARHLATFYTPRLVEEYARYGDTWVVVDATGIVAVAAIEDVRVRNVFVRVERHRQGVGSLLMRYLEGAMAQKGLDRLVLQAGLGAVGFYRRLGFTIVTVTDELIGTTRYTMTVMEKLLQIRSNR